MICARALNAHASSILTKKEVRIFDMNRHTGSKRHTYIGGKRRRSFNPIAALLLLAVCSVAVVALIAIFKDKSGGKVDIIIPPVSTIPVPTEVPASNAPLNTDAPTPSPAPAESATPLPMASTAPSPDYTIFNDCAFVGNSTFEGLYRFGIIKQGKFFTKVGLNILSVYEQTTATGTVPIIDELNTGTYKAVILMFGENELGWPNLNVFIEKYSQLLTDVWQRQPGCKIFIMGIPPVSERKSAEGEAAGTGVYNERIQMYNAQLEELARTRGCYFVTVPSQLINSNGALPDEASSDGLHLNTTYSRYWADHICICVMDGLK